MRCLVEGGHADLREHLAGFALQQFERKNGMWRLLLDFMDILYILTLIGMAIYGLNNLVSVILYLRTKDRPNHRSKGIPPARWPRVTVQLPTFNERYTIERLINAVAHFDYPRDRLQVQILDDSTDDTADLIRLLVKKYSASGLNIGLTKRSDRNGFKAGALAEGLKSATGELVAIFDADFVPSPNWLKKTVPEFRDPRLGCLQTRWGYLNDKFNLLTQAQSLGIDGHFIIEQTARSRNGLFINFNGTAGLWRKTCIEAAGGWQSDTLTEDLDLSYRAQLCGWQIDYLPDVVVPGELPAQIEAFKKQQFRWAKGSFQTLKKLLPSILKSSTPWYKKLLGLLHISGYFVHPLMLMAVVLILPVGLFSPQVLKWIPWTMIAAFGPPMLYLLSETEHLPRLTDRLRLLPILTLMGLGLSLNNTVAAVEGLFGKSRGTFSRTPKFNLSDRKGNWAGSSYTEPISPMVWFELGLGFYALFTSFILDMQLGWQAMPWRVSSSSQGSILRRSDRFTDSAPG
jgi:cellulose synthase/poly-beta-1,6-N-acetylglucosamine synthase-like glycosyltransferase